MAIKVYKPTTPGRRGMSVIDYSELSKVAPEKSLLAPKNKKAAMIKKLPSIRNGLPYSSRFCCRIVVFGISEQRVAKKSLYAVLFPIT